MYFFLGVFIDIQGSSSCHWTELKRSSPHGHRHTRIVDFDGRIDYMNSRTYLAGSQAGEIFDLPIGNYTYTFQCELPAHIPSSFNGQLGHISYNIKVMIDHPWGLENTFTVPLTIIRPHDLNVEPQLKVASTFDMSKTFFCFPCKSDPLHIAITIPKTGYIPGEKIVIRSQINNATSVKINSMEYVLRQMAVFTTQSPSVKTRSELKEVYQIRCPGVEAHKKGDWEQSLLIPDMLPPTTDAAISQIVQIFYSLVVIANIYGHGNMTFAQPITIGTIPIRH